ncbi:MAG: hypothetical protein ABIH17_00600 [Pseudomonadota bacterium]
MSLLSPPDHMPANLLPIWPWIWLQHQLLLAWIRLTYGRGYLYCWAVTPAGRVVLLWIDLESRDRAAVLPLRPPVSPRLAGALSGQDFTPAFLCLVRAARPARILPSATPRHAASRTQALPLPDS